ncbi:MAG TPA: hypothetical protein V6C85_26950 [Allocoleopsis sp.]
MSNSRQTIALTAYAGEIDRQQALADGFQRHLAKPVEPNELYQLGLTLAQMKQVSNRIQLEQLCPAYP